MVRSTFLFALTLLLLGTAPGSAQAEPDLDAGGPERWLDSVVLLVTGAAWCSAVVVDDEGTVATAYHCVANGRRPQVRTRDGARFLARVVATAPRDDLALLEVPDLAGKVSPLTIRAEAPPRGTPVWGLGHPYAPQAETSPLIEGTLQWSVSRGVVSALGERMIQVDAALNPGNSGGPVVDDQGAVVGIASRRLSADNVAFIAPSAALARLIEQPRRRVLGGTWGVSLGAMQGMEVEASPSLGVAAEVALRDRALVRAAFYLPLGQRWAALSLGETRWVVGEAGATARLRAGRGRFSTTFDLGGGCVVREGLESEIADDVVHLWSIPTAVLPALVGAVGMGGSSLRFLGAWEDEGWTFMLGLDLGVPGVMGAF